MIMQLCVLCTIMRVVIHLQNIIDAITLCMLHYNNYYSLMALN